jgi:glycosyltransferase involved in cell wall biosynthesis
MNPPIVVVNASASVGGAELSMLPVLRRLTQEHRVVAYLPGRGPLEQRLSALGVEVRPEFQLDDTLGQASASFGRLPAAGGLLRSGIVQQARLRRALKELGPSVVYCNGFRAQVGATLPGRLAGAKVAWHVRDFSRSGALGAAWRSLAAATSLILANSDATATQASLRHVRRRIRVRWNGIDLSSFVPRDAEPPLPPVAGMAAHLTPWKGHRTFIRVLSASREHIPTLTGHIAGQPLYETAANKGYAAELEREIAGRRLESACPLEALEPDAMPSFYAGLHCLVHAPEREEPFGRVLAEAQAVGVPIVAFDRGAIRSVAGPAGVIVEPGDEAALRDALVALLEDEPRRRAMAKAGVQRASELFDEERYAEAAASDILALT